MTQKLTRENVAALIEAYWEWQLDHDPLHIADALLGELEPGETQVLPPCPESCDLGNLAVAVFTARAAMRKAYSLLTTGKIPCPGEYHDHVKLTLRELEDACLSCSNVIYWMEQRGLAESLPPTPPPASPEGGVQ